MTETPRCGLDGSEVIQSDTDPLIGSTLDRYEIVGLIESGGRGRVYRAKAKGEDGMCAVKVLYGDFAIDPKQLDRARREAHTIAQLTHSNIVHMFDFGRSPEGLIYMAMELVIGRTLEEIIHADTILGPERCANLGYQIASGLSAAHTRGFIHRDMKPSNVMIARYGEVEIVKILDFGAVALMNPAQNARITQIGHVIGTPLYMAPEQVDHRVPPGPSVDLYALGVLMYEMLAGQPPFTGVSPAEVMMQHMASEPPPLPEPHGRLGDLVFQLLQKHPQGRPKDAQAVIEALSEFVPQAFRDRLAQISKIAALGRIKWDERETLDLSASRIKRTLTPMPQEVRVIDEKPREENVQANISTVDLNTTTDPLPTFTANDVTDRMAEPAPLKDSEAKTPVSTPSPLEEIGTVDAAETVLTSRPPVERELAEEARPGTRWLLFLLLLIAATLLMLTLKLVTS